MDRLINMESLHRTLYTIKFIISILKWEKSSGIYINNSFSDNFFLTWHHYLISCIKRNVQSNISLGLLHSQVSQKQMHWPCLTFTLTEITFTICQWFFVMLAWRLWTTVLLLMVWWTFNSNCVVVFVSILFFMKFPRHTEIFI